MSNWTNKRHSDTNKSLVLSGQTDFGKFIASGNYPICKHDLLQYVHDGGRIELTRNTSEGPEYKLLSIPEIERLSD